MLLIFKCYLGGEDEKSKYNSCYFWIEACKSISSLLKHAQLVLFIS